jgi:hypothetical protein
MGMAWPSPPINVIIDMPWNQACFICMRNKDELAAICDVLANPQGFKILFALAQLR